MKTICKRVSRDKMIQSRIGTLHEQTLLIVYAFSTISAAIESAECERQLASTLVNLVGKRSRKILLCARLLT